MKKLIYHSALQVFCIAVYNINYCFSQDSSSLKVQYDSLSLKDLLNVKIVSASKKSESLFDAPLSATVISRQDIYYAGCSSIMEALRLVPGMIVREVNNGNYDIHLRGMENVPPNAPFDGNSTTTLVMIDSRPIYNYLSGGTFWESLPVDLIDVERIEVVRGPAAALFGPNAVSGVINIITRKTDKNGPYLVASAKQGSFQTYVNNISVGYQTSKWNIIASGNAQHRDRVQTSYFELNRNRYIDTPSYFLNILGDSAFNVMQMYPSPGLAMQKYAGNVFANYHANDKTTISLSGGLQHSFAQTVSTDNGITPLTTVQSISRYADVRVNISGFAAQVSVNNGTQKTNFNPGNKYDFTTLDANIDYSYSRSRLSLKPGISYRSAVYDDTKYSDIINKTGLFNARGMITTVSGSLRGEYNFLYNKLRLITGLTASKFNYPDTTYLSYQFALTYKLTRNHLLRAVYSSSPRSANIYDAFIDQTIAYYPTGEKSFTRYAVQSNKDLRLLNAKMLELGYRGKISSSFSLDIEAFDIRSVNYSSLVTNASFTQMAGVDTLRILPIIPTNLPLTLSQRGLTVSIIYSMPVFKVKTYITVQRSWIKNYTSFLNTPDAPPSSIQPDPLKNNIYSGLGTSSNLISTPTVFGGADIRVMPFQQLNCNLGAYFYSEQTYYHTTNTIYNDGVRGIDRIPAKLILTATVTYEIIKGLELSFTAKNLLNNKAREFFRADEVPLFLFAGLKFEL